MVSDGTPNDFVERFLHHQCVAVGKGDERVWNPFDVPNQFGIQNKLVAIISGQSDHWVFHGACRASKEKCFILAYATGSVVKLFVTSRRTFRWKSSSLWRSPGTWRKRESY